MPTKPKRPSSKRGSPTAGKSPAKKVTAKPRRTGKPRPAGSKFSHRPYKPRKPKAKKPRSAEAILKEARAARKALVQRGRRRPIVRAWAMAASSSAQAEPSTYGSTPRPISVSPSPPPALKARSTASRIFEPIIQPVGNAPVIASGHSELDARPEVWVAEDFYAIIEADPEPSSQIPVHLARFRYLMSASCFYRESCNPHPQAPRHPVLICTLEHSDLLPHEEPGFIDRLLGEKAKPINMVVALFTHNARHHFKGVSYDEDFTRGRQRLLGMLRDHLGIRAYFEHAGFFTKGKFNPAMK